MLRSDREALSDLAVRSKHVTDPIYNSKPMDAVGDPWDCELCNTIFAESDATLLEFQSCKKHYGVKCLKKSNTEYDILSKSDTVWLCVKSRKIVQEHIVIDLKIEERCKEIMENYEQINSDIEIENGYAM
jgi:hypothetical protein